MYDLCMSCAHVQCRLYNCMCARFLSFTSLDSTGLSMSLSRHTLLQLLPMNWFGWKTEDNTLQVEWDPPEDVKKQVIQLPSWLWVQNWVHYSLLQMCKYWVVLWSWVHKNH